MDRLLSLAVDLEYLKELEIREFYVNVQGVDLLLRLKHVRTLRFWECSFDREALVRLHQSSALKNVEVTDWQAHERCLVRQDGIAASEDAFERVASRFVEAETGPFLDGVPWTTSDPFAPPE